MGPLSASQGVCVAHVKSKHVSARTSSCEDCSELRSVEFDSPKCCLIEGGRTGVSGVGGVFTVDHRSVTMLCVWHHQVSFHCPVSVTAADVGEGKPNVFRQVGKEKK